MVKKELLFTLVVVSVFFIIGCDVYKTLYIKQIKDVEMVSEEEITIEEEQERLEDETVAKEEVDMGAGKKEISEDANVIIVQETDLVSLVPKAEDPDKDILTFTFTSPLNENGEWQTNYGDVGEYTVTVTVSDGQLTATKEVLIIVKRKEEAPILENFKPEETAITIEEADVMTFEVTASDLNEDVLRYVWKLDGVEVSDMPSTEYKTTYEDAGSHTVKITVTDDIFEAEKIWSVTVNNVNRKPELAEILDLDVKETDTVTIKLEAMDEDGDKLTYSIDNEMFTQDDNIFTWETSYEDEGKHIATLSVSDGTDTTSQEVKITVENINRAPVILDVVQKQ